MNIFRKLLFFVLFSFSCPFFAAEDIKICLTMIVKNDEDVIWRCLSGVSDLIDCISIYDAGSTDNTISLVEQFLEETKIPGKLHRNRYYNNERSRIFALQAAKNTLEKQKFSLSKSYFLVLDPWIRMDIDFAFDKGALEAKSYLLLEKAAGCSRYCGRLLRADHSWGGSDIAYESGSYQIPQNSIALPELTLYCDDFLVDRELRRVRKNITENPDNSHFVFYLAQMNKNLGHYDEAIDGYKRRIEKGGNSEEIWFSKYMLGKCYEELDQWDSALSWYLEAYQTDSRRSEPIQQIITHYRYLEKNEIAYIFAKHGTALDPFFGRTMFDHFAFYNNQFDAELSIIAYYTRFKDEGFATASNLMIRKDASWWAKDLTAKNILFYVQNLPGTQFVPISFKLPFVEDGFTDRYRPRNPSIIKTDEGYLVICGAANYIQKGGIVFNTVDSQGVFRIKNFLLTYDRYWNLLSEAEIVENPSQGKTLFRSPVEGLINCRLLELNHSYWFTGMKRNFHPGGIPKMVLCKLGSHGFSERTMIEKLTLLQGPDWERCEKDWLHFVKDGKLWMIYRYDPWIFYQVNLETGECETIFESEIVHDFSRFRGSAAPIAFEDGYLMLINEECFREDGSFIFLHRFVFFDSNFRFQKLSKPFTFKHQGIEFCCGMTLDHLEKKLILSIAIEEREAMLCMVDVETVSSLLEPLPR